MIIVGVLATLARGLGKPFDAPEVRESTAVAGLLSSTEAFDLGGRERVYRSTDDSSVHFVFEDGALKSIIIATQSDGASSAFDRADELIRGLSGTAAREDVRALLGTPEWTSEDPAEEADQFAVDGYFQHVIFVNGRVARITAMASDPAQW